MYHLDNRYIKQQIKISDTYRFVNYKKNICQKLFDLL